MEIKIKFCKLKFSVPFGKFSTIFASWIRIRILYADPDLAKWFHTRIWVRNFAANNIQTIVT